MFYSCMTFVYYANKDFLPSGNKKHQVVIFRLCTPRSIANRHLKKKKRENNFSNDTCHSLSINYLLSSVSVCMDDLSKNVNNVNTYRIK